MFLRYCWPAFIWTLVIFGLCSMPGKSIPHISWLELLSFDKFVHASIFFLLQLFYMRGFRLQTSFPVLQKNYMLIPAILCIAYGGALEIMQALFFSERSADWFDFIANSFGCMMALLVYRPLSKRIRFLRAAL
jgi:glycopeptide antibiotics resistance protein